MENSSKKKGVFVLGLLLIFVGIVAQILVLITGKEVLTATSMYIVATIVSMAALLFAGFYIATGFKKSSSLFYKLFVYMFLGNMLLALTEFALVSSSGGYTPIEIVISIFAIAVPFGLLNELAFAYDLGKKKSLLIAYSILALIIFSVVFRLGRIFVLYESPETLIRVLILRDVSPVTLSAVLVSSVHMKYYDKELRHTK